MAYKIFKRNLDRRKLALRNARARTLYFSKNRPFNTELVLYFQKLLDRNQHAYTRIGLGELKRNLSRKRRRQNKRACYFAWLGDEMRLEQNLSEGFQEEFDWMVW